MKIATGNQLRAVKYPDFPNVETTCEAAGSGAPTVTAGQAVSPSFSGRDLQPSQHLGEGLWRCDTPQSQKKSSLTPRRPPMDPPTHVGDGVDFERLNCCRLLDSRGARVWIRSPFSIATAEVSLPLSINKKFQ